MRCNHQLYARPDDLKLRPRLHNQLWRDDLADDSFALAIPFGDANPGVAELQQLMKSAGAEEVELYDTTVETMGEQARAERQHPVEGEQSHA